MLHVSVICFSIFLDTVAVFPAVDRLVSSSQNDVVMSTVPNGNRISWLLLSGNVKIDRLICHLTYTSQLFYVFIIIDVYTGTEENQWFVPVNNSVVHKFLSVNELHRMAHNYVLCKR